MKRLLLIAILPLVGAGCFGARAEIASFEDCVAAGNPVMESYPRQCRAGGTTFVEAANPPSEPEPGTGLPDGAVLLAVGAPFALDDTLTLTLMSIEDSRCPEGVQCVWAGELAALVRVAASGPDGGSLELRLGQVTASEGVAYGYAIRLVAATETSAAVVVTKR